MPSCLSSHGRALLGGVEVLEHPHHAPEKLVGYGQEGLLLSLAPGKEPMIEGLHDRITPHRHHGAMYSFLLRMGGPFLESRVRSTIFPDSSLSGISPA